MKRSTAVILALAVSGIAAAEQGALAAVVISDTFTAANGTALVSRTPDTTDTPGGTYGLTFDGFQDDIQSNRAVMGANTGLGVSIANGGAYSRPADPKYTISFLFNQNTVNGPDAVGNPRGVGLGFYNRVLPANDGAHAYVGFTGLHVDILGNVRVIVGGAGADSVVTQAGSPVATGGWVGGNTDHTLSYDIDILTGTIANVLLDTNSVAITAPASTFTNARTVSAGFYVSANSGGAVAQFDNFIVNDITSAAAGTENFIVPATLTQSVLLNASAGTFTGNLSTTNNGTAAGAFTAAATGAGISVNPTNGPSVPQTNSSPLTVSHSTAAAGTFTGTVTVAPNASGNPTAGVTLIVANATAKSGLDNGMNVFGPTLSALVTSGGSYAGLASTVTAVDGSGPFFGSTATLRQGNAASDQTVTMAWRTSSVNETPATQTSPPLYGANHLLADVVQLQGMSGAANSVHQQVEEFTLDMNYDSSIFSTPTDEAEAQSNGFIRLVWLDRDFDVSDGTNVASALDLWTFATEGNFGGPGSSAVFNFAGSYADFATAHGDLTANYANYLGSYGSDILSADHTVWAILNHNSDFSVVPEPASLGFLALGAIGLLARRRKA